jgi:hypothetical protein
MHGSKSKLKRLLRLTKVSAEIKMSRPAPEVVDNH